MALSNADQMWMFKRTPGHAPRGGNIGQPQKEVEVEPLEIPVAVPEPDKVTEPAK